MSRALRPSCHCLDAQYEEIKWSELKLHTEQQDTTCSAWKRLLELIDEAAHDKCEEFSPGNDLTTEQWSQIVTLPVEIAKLKSVKYLDVHGSSLVRIPREIGELASLEEFIPYKSYRLHWFPYEITRCTKLKDSSVSTRALYGNNKYRPPFPRLPQRYDSSSPTECSVCDSPLDGMAPIQYWVSLRVATDVLPLLVNACSIVCLKKVPKSHKGYVPMNQGGLEIDQRSPEGLEFTTYEQDGLELELLRADLKSKLSQ